MIDARTALTTGSLRYPVTGTPYTQGPNSPYFLKATGPGARFETVERRVLNLLIVQCSTGGGACRPAEKKASGRFFMQTKASTDDQVYLEFGGLTTPLQLKPKIRLYR